MKAFFSQLFLRIWAGCLLYSKLEFRKVFKKSPVRCETCPRWTHHDTIRPTLPGAAKDTFVPLVPLGICRLSKPAVINQGGIGFGLKLFHPDDWCPHHPLYRPAPASDLPAYTPPLEAPARDGAGMEPEPFQRAPTFEEAMRLARILEAPPGEKVDDEQLKRLAENSPKG